MENQASLWMRSAWEKKHEQEAYMVRFEQVAFLFELNEQIEEKALLSLAEFPLKLEVAA